MAEARDPPVMDGAIPICHLVCAPRHWLVIDGEQEGLVWGDYRGTYYGIRPLLDSEGGRVTFAAWYVTWPERASRECDGADARQRGEGP